MTKQTTLKVPVQYKRIIDGMILQMPGGMLHDTNYTRGADSYSQAAQWWADDMTKVGHNRWSVDYVMDVVNPFRARLQLTGYCKSGSRAYMEFSDELGQKWPMFLKDATKLLSSASMDNGLIEEFEYETIKRGTAYGIRKVKS
jgi:hypothetical protein